MLHLDAAMPVPTGRHSATTPTAKDLAGARPLQTSTLLSELVRSPIFPREH